MNPRVRIGVVRAVSIALFCFFAVSSRANAQISVTLATPNSAAPNTLNLDVTVNGKGFKNGASAQWFVTGTTNPGGVTVNSTKFVNSTTLTANITVSSTAVIGSFDVQVKNSDGRTGKGTELFAVVNNGSAKSTACVSPVPLNPVINACSSATAQSGCMDSTFGGNGVTMTNVPRPANAFSWISTMRQQSDGKLVAIGFADPYAVAVARYTSDGVLDTTFGSGLGYVEYVFNTGTGVFDSALDAAGNILVTGLVGPELYVLRFTSEGVLDPSFATNGIFKFASSARRNPNAVGYALLVQADGKILVGGSDSPGGAILRLNNNGTLDNTFATKGVFISANGYYALTFQNVGNTPMIVGAGQNGNYVQLDRLTLDGALDPTFGSNGSVSTAFCGQPPFVRSVLADSAGNLYTAGVSRVSQNAYALDLVAKYSSIGKLDTTFGDANGSGTRNGFTLFDLFGSSNFPQREQALAFTSDTSGNPKLLVTSNSGGTYALVRLNMDGTVDSTFGMGGASAYKLTTDDIPEGSFIEGNGEIVTFGTSGTNGNDMFTLFRVWP
jgi:uncharacterized delta-60 repeat protein